MPLKFLQIPDLTDGDIVRLWASIRLAGANECWLWQRRREWQGYGKMKLGTVEYTVTRVLWKHWFGFDPGDFEICHSCNNPPCCNPNHLFRGTRSQNAQHAYDSGRKPMHGPFHPRWKAEKER